MQTNPPSPFAKVQAQAHADRDREVALSRITSMPEMRFNGVEAGRGRGRSSIQNAVATESFTRMQTVQHAGVTVTQANTQLRRMSGDLSDSLEAPRGHKKRSRDSHERVSAGAHTNDEKSSSGRTSEDERRNTVGAASSSAMTVDQLRNNEYGGYRSSNAAEWQNRRHSHDEMRRRGSRDIEMGHAYSSESDGGVSRPSLQITINQGNNGSTSQEIPRQRREDAPQGAQGDEPGSPHLRGVFWGVGPRLDVQSTAYRVTVGVLQGILYLAAGGGGLALTATVIHNAVAIQSLPAAMASPPSFNASAPS